MAVRCRHHEAEGSWVKDVSVLVVDEAHFLSSEGRGDHLEHSLVLFTSIAPDARLVLLSATLRNANEIAFWLGHITRRKIVVIESAYRPSKLNVHLAGYISPGGHPWTRYAKEEAVKIQETMGLVEEHPKDQWLVFVHAKGTGGKVLAALQEKRIPAAFHSADLDLDERSKVEENFRSGKIRVLVATSTLAYGLNLPARRVAVVGVERGFNEVDPLDVIQECGRAGRPRYDTEGDAYVVISAEKVRKWDEYLKKGIDVRSALAEKIGFHLIGEVTEKRVNTPKAVLQWAERTLAWAQKIVTAEDIIRTVGCYRVEGLIQQDAREGGEVPLGSTNDDIFSATTLGVIASKNYFDPLDVVSWKRNLQTLQTRDLGRNTAAIAWALASVPSMMKGFIAKNLKEEASDYLGKIHALNLRVPSNGALALATCLDLWMSREEAILKPHRAVFHAFVVDAERVLNCLEQIATRVLNARWGRDYWEMLLMRLQYGVGWEEADLCTLPGIGKVHAGRLLGAGIHTVEELSRKREVAREVLPEKTFEKVMTRIDGVRNTTSVPLW